MIIVTDQEIIEKYRVTKNFVNKHSRRMGAFSRNPRKFIAERVEAYIADLAARNASRASPEVAKMRRKQMVDQLFKESVAAVQMRKKRNI